MLPVLLPFVTLPSGDEVHRNTEETDHLLHHDEEKDRDQLPFPGFVDRSFFCLYQTTPIRYHCLKLVSWPWLGHITIFIILLNCITLAMYQPCEQHCDTFRCLWATIADHCIFVFFAIEMCIKMIAMSVIGKGTYLTDGWNRLDCFIVVTGYDHHHSRSDVSDVLMLRLIEYMLPGDHLSLSIIRTIRVLRPLRAVHCIPSMRILVMLLIDTLPSLGNLLLLCFFVFSIFGIIGVHLWKGLLRNRCFLQLNSTLIDRYAGLE